jgi:hypothetical protein
MSGGSDEILSQEQFESNITINDATNVVSVESPNVDTVSTENIVTDIIINETFVDSLVRALSNEATSEQVRVSIKPNFIEVIKKIKLVSSLNDIESSLTEIAKDGKINSGDLHFLILAVKNLYKLLYNSKIIKVDYKKRGEIVGDLIKVSIHVLVVERKISICEENQSDFLKQVDCLVDACVDMLSYTRSIKTRACAPFFVNLFK